MAALNDTVGEGYLDRFDELDLDQGIESRRMALFCMENFYADLMATIGEKALNCDRTIYEGSLSEQWDQIELRINEVVSPNNCKSIHKYGNMIESEIQGERNSLYHKFNRGIGKEKLREYRDEAPKVREVFLEIGEKYQKYNGAYSEESYNQVKKNVEDAALKPERYPWACKMLKQEFAYIEKVALKQDGQSPGFIRDIGSHLYLGGFIDKKQFRKIGQVIIVADGKYSDLDVKKGERIIDDGLDVLGFLYRSLNPYHSESLLTTKFVDAVEESGFTVTRAKEKEREVWIDYSVEFGDLEMRDGGLILQPRPNGVTVLSPYFSRSEVEDLPEDEEENLRRLVRKRDQLNGEEVLLVWNRHVEVDDEHIQEAFEGHWPPEDTQ